MPSIVIGAAVLASTIARGDQIRTLDGDLGESLVAIEGTGDALVVKTAARTIPIASVKEIVFSQAERELHVALPARVFLAAGDEIAGEVTGGNESRLVVKNPLLGSLQLSLESLRAIAFTSDDSEIRRFRRDVLPLETKKDVVITRSWSQQEGVLERVDPRGVSFTTDALGTVSLGPDKILGACIRQFGKKPVTASLRARLDLACGSTLFGKLHGVKGGMLSIETSFGTSIDVRTADVRVLSFSGGRIVYVSDLLPEEVEERAKMIRVVFHHREDADVTGNPIRLAGNAYRKGIGVHAYSRLVYSLGGAFSRLRAVIGLDDSARDRRDVVGTVRFQVIVDGKPGLGEQGVLMTSRDPPRPIDLDVAGAAKVALIADFGESQDTLARGVWGDAYLIRK